MTPLQKRLSVGVALLISMLASTPTNAKTVAFCGQNLPLNVEEVRCAFSDASIAPLTRLKRLKKLILTFPGGLFSSRPVQDWHLLSRLKALHTLEIRGSCYDTTALIPHLPAAKRLRRLSIPATPETLKALRALPSKWRTQLRVLGLRRCSQYNDLGSLSMFAGLEEVVLKEYDDIGLYELHTLPNLRRLTLSSYTFDAEQLDGITGLQQLNIEGTIADLNALDLSQSPDLTELELSLGPNADISTLGKATKLKVLRLNLASPGLTRLDALVNLKELEVFALEGFGSADLTVLEAWTKLKHLTLKIKIHRGSLPLSRHLQNLDLPILPDSISVAVYSRIRHLTNLERLSVHDPIEGWTVFARLRNLKKLKWLSIEGGACSDLQESHSKQHNSRTAKTIHLPRTLTTLILDRLALCEQGLTFLKGQKKLETLEISHLSLKGGFRGLKHARNLRRLTVAYSMVDNIAPLTVLTRLEHLELPFMSEVQDWSPLARLTQLHHLDIMSTRFSDTSFLRRLTKLRHLNISESLSHEDLRFLAHNKELNTLILSGYHITSLSVLTLLPHLRHLNLGQTIEIEDPQQLQRLKHLDYLELYDFPAIVPDLPYTMIELSPVPAL